MLDRRRRPAVAGRFYPADPDRLTADVTRYVADAGPWKGPAPEAVIAPHAGFVYSGPFAGSAYASIASLRLTSTSAPNPRRACTRLYVNES